MGMTDHTIIPDYDLDDVLYLTTPEQFKAITGSTRPKILGLLGQWAATTKQMAEILGLPKGTVGHHLKVLEEAGLLRVVRTRQVRAITEKYYGRVARTYRISTDECAPGVSGAPIPQDVSVYPLRQAMSEYAPALEGDDPSTFIITHARMPASRAREFAHRLEALSNEFSHEPTPSEKVYGLVAGIYLTDWPDLGTTSEEDHV
jgi:DNA-binding transcriptional ArsR family regulator